MSLQNLHKKLRRDAETIWTAAISAVRPQSLVKRRLSVDLVSSEVYYDEKSLEPPVYLNRVGRIVIVGGGKAAAAIAEGLESVIGKKRLDRHNAIGIVNVPEGMPEILTHVRKAEVRLQGSNSPTIKAMQSTSDMLELVKSLNVNDLVFVVLSGGASAMMVAPRDTISLEEKIVLTEFLSKSGANIEELNQVRRSISRVKAGGLARACRAGRMVVLVLSDVIGDSLEVIGSGPCVDMQAGEQSDSSANESLAVLTARGAIAMNIAPGIVHLLSREASAQPLPARSIGVAFASSVSSGEWTTSSGCRVSHRMLGSNASAVDAAALAAKACGYDVLVRQADPTASESAESVGQRLFQEAATVSQSVSKDSQSTALLLAIIEGGEATVQVPIDHGSGGRNQQTVLAALVAAKILEQSQVSLLDGAWPKGVLLASLGTDGEDGPTTTAGGFADADIFAAITRQNLVPQESLLRCDAEPLLVSTGGAIRIGPTGTNVADIRLLLIRSKD